MFGQLKLHGICPTSLWTKLGATAPIGATQLTLAEPVNGMWLDREIVISTTSKEAYETEVRTVTAVFGNVISIDAPLDYEHIAETFTLQDGTEYTMAGEVGLLNHNIVIEGMDYPTIAEDGFGGRVLVSTVSTEFFDYYGEGICYLTLMYLTNQLKSSSLYGLA